jgi:hypothetical protein
LHALPKIHSSKKPRELSFAFVQGKSKNFVDAAVHQRRSVPGPAQYSLPDMNKPGGGKFNMSRPKTDVDWAILRAAKVGKTRNFTKATVDHVLECLTLHECLACCVHMCLCGCE